MDLHPLDTLRAQMTADIVAGSIRPDRFGRIRPQITSEKALAHADAIIDLVREHQKASEPKSADYPLVEICPACRYRLKFENSTPRNCDGCGRLIVPFPIDKDEPETPADAWEGAERFEPNPVKGLTVELPQIPGLDLELRGRRTIATMHQDYLKASEAAMVQSIKDQGAREERERLIALETERRWAEFEAGRRFVEPPSELIKEKASLESEIRAAWEPKP